MPCATRKKSPSRAANTRRAEAEVNISIIPQAKREHNQEYHLARIVEMLGNVKSEKTMEDIYWFVERRLVRE